jgi:stage V sporulation protein AD
MIMKRITKLKNCIGFHSYASVGGREERRGPLGELFDICDPSDKFGQKTWEQAESEMQKRAIKGAISKSHLMEHQIELLLAGDLLNQCVGSSYASASLGLPFLGLYGACSTCAEGLGLGACLCDRGICDACAVVTSSHYCASERQFRFPLEYGGVRTPTSQWTFTVSGAVVVSDKGIGCPKIKYVTTGKMVNKNVCDANKTITQGILLF